MNTLTRLYVKFIPIYSILLIWAGALRIAIGFQHIYIFLLCLAILDAVLVIHYLGTSFSPLVIVVTSFLLSSFVLGIHNDNILSRRYITDVINPLFFFAKILLFKKYWRRESFNAYVRYYVRVAIVGSMISLPLVYYVFSRKGATRMAIFPPLELPLLSAFYSNAAIVLILFLMIVL